MQRAFSVSIPAQKFREAVFQMLYSYDIGRTAEKNAVELLVKELSITKKTAVIAWEKMLLVCSHLSKIDEMIARTSQSYSFDRIQSVERNVLRLGIYELFFDEGIPAKVALSEALRLARKFSTKESASFVNAILDTLYKSSLGQEIDRQMLVRTERDLTESEQIAQKAASSPQAQIDDQDP